MHKTKYFCRWKRWILYLFTVIDGGTAAYSDGTRDCSEDLTRSSASSEKSYHYTATGITDSTVSNEYDCEQNSSSYP